MNIDFVYRKFKSPFNYYEGRSRIRLYRNHTRFK